MKLPPDIDRSQAIEAIRFLNQPMLRVHVQRLRQAFREFQSTGNVKAILATIEEVRKTAGTEASRKEGVGKTGRLKREELRLICFDLITAG